MTNRPYALVVSSIVPGTNGGAPVVSLGLLQTLSELGYELGFIRDERGAFDGATLEGLATNLTPPSRGGGAWRKVARGVSRLASEGFLPKWNPAVWQAVRRAAMERHPSVVVLDTLRVVEYGRLLKEFGYTGRIILLEHNVEYGLKERELELTSALGKRLELSYRIRKLKRVESSLSRYVDACLALTTVDQEWLSRLNPGLQVAFVPPALDLDHYRTEQAVPASRQLLFIGSYTWPPNLDGIEWFVREVWPLVRRSEPDATLVAIGRNPPQWLNETPGITATGFVADERPYYEASRAAIAPLRFGSGVRVKILHGLAMARPMISTRVGAEGIPVQHEHSLMFADAAEPFAEAVVRVLRDDGLARSLASNGRSVCVEWYSPQAVQRRLAQVIEGAKRLP